MDFPEKPLLVLVVLKRFKANEFQKQRIVPASCPRLCSQDLFFTSTARKRISFQAETSSITYPLRLLELKSTVFLNVYRTSSQILTGKKTKI